MFDFRKLFGYKSKFPEYKLGLLPKKEDVRTLRFASYLDLTELPEPPESHNVVKDITDWKMFLNNQMGCCAISAAGHMIMAWTDRTDKDYVPSDDQILTAYSAVSGYNPVTKENDRGCIMLEALKYWRNSGIADRQISAFAELDFQDNHEIKTAIYLFNGIYIGLQLPKISKNQTGPGGIWSVPLYGNMFDGRKNSWGGHAVNVIGYDKDFVYCVTWGFIQKMTWEFLKTYCGEAYAIISEDYIYCDKTIEGFDKTMLMEDLNKI